MFPSRPAAARRVPLRVCVVLLATVLAALSACSALVEEAPEPTPADFQGIAALLVQRGITIDNLVSGDAGCDDPILNPTAIGLDAHGLDQDEPVRIYLYIFRNRSSFDRLRSTIDGCARSYVTDPQSFESIEASPFVAAGQGPWAREFETTLRESLVEAAGTGN